jgi:hypothetical protein
MCLICGHLGHTVANIWMGRCCHGMLSLQVVTIVVGAVCGKCCFYCACPVQSICVTNMFVLCVRWGGRGMGSKEEEEKEAEQKV